MRVCFCFVFSVYIIMTFMEKVHKLWLVTDERRRNASKLKAFRWKKFNEKIVNGMEKWNFTPWLSIGMMCSNADKDRPHTHCLFISPKSKKFFHYISRSAARWPNRNSIDLHKQLGIWLQIYIARGQCTCHTAVKRPTLSSRYSSARIVWCWKLYCSNFLLPFNWKTGLQYDESETAFKNHFSYLQCRPQIMTFINTNLCETSMWISCVLPWKIHNQHEHVSVHSFRAFSHRELNILWDRNLGVDELNSLKFIDSFVLVVSWKKLNLRIFSRHFSDSHFDDEWNDLTWPIFVWWL